MRSLALLLALLAACAAPRPPSGQTEGGPSVLRPAELARVRCLLVAPLENGSNVPDVTGAATAALLAGVDPARARALPLGELRGIFAGTPLELPEGVSSATALELAELLGADAALHGAVEGRSRQAGTALLLTLRLTLAGSRDVLFADDLRVEPAPGEAPDVAVARVARERARPMLERLGGTAPADCFPAARREALRKAALALRTGPSQPAAHPAAAARAQPAPEPPAKPGAGAALHTPRQREWAHVLAAGGRLILEDVAFAGRTSELVRDGGLADLALVLAATPALSVRLEGFVDATGDRPGDLKLSTAMAQAAQRRLRDLGVEGGRVEAGGRGGESPVLPNFTARGRSANRRLEAVSAK
jgi:outer membrane protein OmpA-like peptidoglycan-associated protein